MVLQSFVFFSFWVLSFDHLFGSLHMDLFALQKNSSFSTFSYFSSLSLTGYLFSFYFFLNLFTVLSKYVCLNFYKILSKSFAQSWMVILMKLSIVITYLWNKEHPQGVSLTWVVLNIKNHNLKLTTNMYSYL